MPIELRRDPGLTAGGYPPLSVEITPLRDVESLLGSMRLKLGSRSGQDISTAECGMPLRVLKTSLQLLSVFRPMAEKHSLNGPLLDEVASLGLGHEVKNTELTAGVCEEYQPSLTLLIKRGEFNGGKLRLYPDTAGGARIVWEFKESEQQYLLKKV
jgi:hypothetical protein